MNKAYYIKLRKFINNLKIKSVITQFGAIARVTCHANLRSDLKSSGRTIASQYTVSDYVYNKWTMPNSF